MTVTTRVGQSMRCCQKSQSRNRIIKNFKERFSATLQKLFAKICLKFFADVEVQRK